jgi:hypothetical protein
VRRGIGRVRRGQLRRGMQDGVDHERHGRKGTWRWTRRQESRCGCLCEARRFTPPCRHAFRVERLHAGANWRSPWSALAQTSAKGTPSSAHCGELLVMFCELRRLARAPLRAWLGPMVAMTPPPWHAHPPASAKSVQRVATEPPTTTQIAP